MNACSLGRRAVLATVVTTIAIVATACSSAPPNETSAESDEALNLPPICVLTDPHCTSTPLDANWLQRASFLYRYEELRMREAGCKAPFVLVRGVFPGDPRDHRLIVHECPIGAGYGRWSGAPACDLEQSFPGCDRCTGVAETGFMWVAKAPPECLQPGCPSGSCGSPAVPQ